MAESPNGFFESIELLATLLECSSPLLHDYLEPSLSRAIALISQPLSGDAETHRVYLISKIVSVVPSTILITNIKPIVEDILISGTNIPGTDVPMSTQSSKDSADIGARKPLQVSMRKPTVAITAPTSGNISETIAFRGINFAIGAVSDFLGLTQKSSSWLLPSRGDSDSSESGDVKYTEYDPFIPGLCLPVVEFEKSFDKTISVDVDQTSPCVNTSSEGVADNDIAPSILWDIVVQIVPTTDNETSCFMVLKSVRTLIAKHPLLHRCIGTSSSLEIVKMIEKVLILIAPSLVTRLLASLSGKERIVSGIVLEGRRERNPEAFLENCYHEILGIVYGQDEINLGSSSYCSIVPGALQLLVLLYSSSFPMVQSYNIVI